MSRVFKHTICIECAVNLHFLGVNVDLDASKSSQLRLFWFDDIVASPWHQGVWFQSRSRHNLQVVAV